MQQTGTHLQGMPGWKQVMVTARVLGTPACLGREPPGTCFWCSLLMLSDQHSNSDTQNRNHLGLLHRALYVPSGTQKKQLIVSLACGLAERNWLGIKSTSLPSPPPRGEPTAGLPFGEALAPLHTVRVLHDRAEAGQASSLSVYLILRSTLG